MTLVADEYRRDVCSRDKNETILAGCISLFLPHKNYRETAP